DDDRSYVARSASKGRRPVAGRRGGRVQGNRGGGNGGTHSYTERDRRARAGFGGQIGLCRLRSVGTAYSEGFSGSDRPHAAWRNYQRAEFLYDCACGDGARVYSECHFTTARVRAAAERGRLVSGVPTVERT